VSPSTTAATPLSPDVARPAEAVPRRSRARTALGSPLIQGSLTAAVFFVVFAIYGAWLGGRFLNVDARLLDVHQNAPILVLGLAVLVTLVAGQFDLSVASMATLTTFLAVGLGVKNGWPFGLVIAACLAVGLAGGLLNGLLVVVLRVNAFIATLGTGAVFAGLSRVYSGGTQLAPTATGRQLPSWFSGGNSLGAFGTKFPTIILVVLALAAAAGAVNALRGVRPESWDERRWLILSIASVGVAALLLIVVLDLPAWLSGTSWMIGLLLIIGLVLWTMLRLTSFGRYLEATGANPGAARLSGVKIGAETIKAFMIGGLLAAVAGLFLAATQGSAAVDAGVPFLLPAFAAAFLSTVVFSTGHFTVWGTLLGGIFVVYVGQGLIVGGVPFTWTDVINGTVLVFAVAISTILRRNST
jgi:ribose/xylose/arabinose/galactoside ABC-type transport system permease subunit